MTRKWRTHKDTRGFTLIEMLLVIALIAVMATMALPTVSSYFRVSLDTASREIAAKIRESYNSTVVTGYVHRMAYDIDKGQYWVEVGTATVLLDTEETLKKQEEREKRVFEKKEKKSPFKLSDDITPKKLKLPSGVVFEDIQTAASPEPIKEGIVYTHFFPQGATEKTVLHIKNRDGQQHTLSVSALGGRTQQYGAYVSQKDIDSGH